jgi:predicted patatin/cPLA2 family phospholipase
MEFYVVCTDAITGKAVYHKCEKGDSKDIEYMRASASMPMFSKLVEIDGQLLSDGGTADSIPVRFFESMGYCHNIVILTQPYGFVKQKNKYLPIMRRTLRKYPNLVKALENRHDIYNDTLAYIQVKEQSGDFLVIRPSRALNVGPMEKDPSKLEEVYQLGRQEALKRLEEIKDFASDNNNR